MANAKRMVVQRDHGRSAAHATLITAFMTDTGAVLPKGVTGFTFRAPRNAVEVFAAEPAKVEPVLKGYGEAVARSRVAGRPVSFRVEVDPSGRAIVTLDAEAAIFSRETEAPAPELQAAIDEARQRGRGQAAEILAGEDMLSADEFAGLLGTTRMTVNTKRQNHQLLGLDGAKRGFRFPAWQVGEDGKPFAALPALFERLGGGPWAVYRFLVQAHPELDGLTGREALRRGKTEMALQVADGIAQGTFA